MYKINIQTTIFKLVSVFLMLALAGCAMNRNQKAVEMKRLLAAAGFKMRLADSESKLAQLKELPQRKLVAQDWSGKVVYVYADASNCKCAYVGDEEAYKHFRDLALERQISEEDRRATAREQPDDMEGGGWR